MTSGKSKLQLALSALTLLVLLAPLASPWAFSQPEPVAAAPLLTEPNTSLAVERFDAWTDLFRAWVTLPNATSRARLDALGVVVLEASETRAMILADGEQLETLARLRFQPEASDDLGMLVARQSEASSWLVESIQPLLGQAREVRSFFDERAVAANSPELLEAQADLRTALHSLTVDQQAGIMSLISVDSDGDGLTDTEESWWCTDPNDANSDGDANGYSDGHEVDALLDATLPRNVRWGYGAPFGPPNAWPDWNGADGNPNTPACNDGDWDTIPDYAEAYMVGSSTLKESTDLDKFDDGQELFGVTHCPGASTSCGYGSYPRIEYWSYIQANMPNWVEPPGDSLFVAAFPVPEVSVVASSWTVERVTTVTTAQGEMTQATNTYETSVTDGQSSSISNTETWNEWEEVSEAVETPMAVSSQLLDIGTASHWADPVWGSLQVWGGELLAAPFNFMCDTVSVGCYTRDMVTTGLTDPMIKDGWNKIDPDVVQFLEDSAAYEASISSGLSTDAGEISMGLSQNLQGISTSLDGVKHAINAQGRLLSQRLADIAYQISRPRLTETRTNGRSWGGSQTTTHEVYEEHAITEGEAFTTGQNWSTAWAVDSSHAADLTFNYTVKNTGTEYAREISGLIFNIYLGGDSTPIISYPAWEQFNGGKLENVFPGDIHTFSSSPVPLTLEQMKRIDMGEKLTVVMEDYSFGADELFYRNAVNGSVSVYIEDGVADGDELVDMYVIPTWGVETVQDVLARYFPTSVDENNRINALWTPEFNGVNSPTWEEHFLSDIAWWNIYFTQNDAGNVSLHELAAMAGSALLFRFNRDSDRDGYQDRVEDRYGTDKIDSASHPHPEILAGYTATQEGNEVTVLLKISNIGTFDAYGIDAVMYAPDDTVTIGNNTVGGNGHVSPNSQVAVGSSILGPNLNNWLTSTAAPYVIGNFSGSVDKTITITVNSPGIVGQGSTALDWTDGMISNTLDVGSDYHAPLPITVTEGIYVGFNTGTLISGDSFTIDALTPRDTFTYTINSTLYTPPVIVVSYSDPQGSHRFITPVELSGLEEDLMTYSGQMLPDVGVSIITSDTVDAAGINTTHFIINNPHPEPIEDAHLYLNFVADGEIVANIPHTLTLQSGPSVIPVQWSTDVFSQTYDATADNILIAFWTDAQNNIIDSAARPLNTFKEDVSPIATYSTTQIDFGTVLRGQVLHKEIAVANTGLVDLLNAVTTSSDELTVSSSTWPAIHPASFVTVTIDLDTSNLPGGAYSGDIQVRTNDVVNPVQTIQIAANVVDLPVVVYSPDDERPLNEYILISGNHSANMIVSAASSVELHEETKPLYFVAEDDTVAGKGDVALELGEPPTQVYETTANIIAPFPDSDARPEASQVILGAFSNPSFETGTRYPWAFLPYNDSCNWAIYNWPTVAFHGDWLLATNMNDNPDCSGFYQEDDTQPMAIGDTYRFAFWVRSSSSSPRSGSLSLWGLGGTTEVQQMGFEVGPTWTCVETSLTVQKSGHTRMRTEVYLRSYDHTNYYFDNASFTRNGGPICPKPTTPTLNNISNSDGDGSYTVTWNASTYALTYQLQERYENGSWSTVYDGSGTSQSRSGRTPGTWCYQVRATNNAGSSNWSAIKCTTVKPASAPVLSDISNADGDGNYTVTWSGVTGATSYLLQEQHDGGSWVSIYTGSSTSQNLTGRTSGTWCYQVQASNASGSGPWSVTKCTTVNILPNLPTGLLPANNAGWLGHAPVLEWQDGGDPDNAPNPYRLFRVNVASLTWDTITAWSQDQSWQESVPADDIYTWRTQAYDGLATSSWTPVQTLRVYSIEKSGANEISLALPEDVFDFVRYKVQYAVEATITDSLTPSVTRITLPKRTYDAASLNLILAEAMGTSVTFSIDVGNDGLNVWSDTISWDGVTPVWVDSPDLAVALNSYLATLGVSSGAMVDVPIAISLDTEGVVYLTNVFLTPGIDSDPAISAGDISLSDPSPMETSLVTVTATIDNLGDYEARNIMATLVVSDSIVGPSIVGNDFIPMIVSGGAAQADIVWDTTGYSGNVNLSVILDIAEQLVELDENNNTTTITVPVRSRPDIQADSWDLFNSEPVVGEAVTITVNLLNGGQTTSGPAIYALYDGNPGNGGLLLDTQIQSGLGANESDSITLSWTPTMPGPYRLFLRLDENGAINEFDEANNLLWQDVYVGLAGPIYLDSGVTASDPVYSSTLGYGYIDIGAPDVFLSCGGGNPEDTSRLDPDGSVNYRFNHLLPGHFYHLDVTLYECDGAGRQETVWVNGHQVAGPVDLGDGQVHRLSLLLDPALYSGHTIQVEVTAEGIDGALVNEVNLYDVDYRYADAGGPRDPQYPGGALVNLGYPYGWLNGVANTAWGTLPSRSVRVNQTGNLLEYRFDGLKPEKRYNIHLSFWQPSGTARLQRIQLDGLDTGLTVNTGDFQMHQETIAVPPTAYTADGSVVVGVLRTNAATGAMVNEIALEEETLPRSGWCNVRQTPYFTDVYGDVAILSQGAPAGTVIEARNPRGDTVGCFVVGTAGQYGFMRIYGEDTTATPAIPGMRAGELVAFHVNGAPAVATPQLYWQADYATHRVDLNAGSITGQSILFQAGWNLISFWLEPPVPTVRQVLDSIDGRYDHVLGEIGAYAPAVPDVFNTLKELHPGLGYYVRISGSTSASALIEGLTVPVTTPILLHQGWNWIGYLPEATLPITVALQSIEGQYQRVLSLDKTYDPALPGYSTLHSMEPGRGYLIYANGAVTLTYPAAGALLNVVPQRSVSSGCENLNPTPKFTLLYGDLLLGDQPAPVGSRVEVLTPRGDIAGCLVLEKPGVIGFMQVYGEDATTSTPIPGFRDGEELTFRVNGVPVETEPLLWRDDWTPHAITLKVDRIQLYLPLVIRDGE